MSRYHTRILTRLNDISPEDWNDCCYNSTTRHNPFVSHEFLSALEDSGCATAESGWQPQHIIVSEQDRMVGAMPLYLKSHSMGEYVFDQPWANAFQNAGGRYYPKLQSSVPFTPVTGPRLMTRPDTDPAPVREKLVNTALSLVAQRGLSSLHVTFAEQAEQDFLEGRGFLSRLDQQFHWLNDGYGSFDDFLAALSSRKRKNIRKERRQAVINDIEIEILCHDDITEQHWDRYYTFYLDTGQRKWGQPYLNRLFFSLLHERLPERTLLIMAKRHGRYIAGALNLISDDTLYGRYWGATEHHKYLHFEVCYYQAIDYAIAHGLKKVEAGAQGEHKLARGYLPTTTRSSHWISNPSFRDAIADYLTRERDAVTQDKQVLLHFAPFRKDKPQ